MSDSGVNSVSDVTEREVTKLGGRQEGVDRHTETFITTEWAHLGRET